jgi:hypothetical protein
MHFGLVIISIEGFPALLHIDQIFGELDQVKFKHTLYVGFFEKIEHFNFLEREIISKTENSV